MFIASDGEPYLKNPLMTSAYVCASGKRFSSVMFPQITIASSIFLHLARATIKSLYMKTSGLYQSSFCIILNILTARSTSSWRSSSPSTASLSALSSRATYRLTNSPSLSSSPLN
ncbi:Os07g0549150, partial [Oryza sativa Japonica Group]